MQPNQILSFGPYRLDLAGAQLWRGKQEVRMTGKAFAVLRYLVTHAGELVTKDALFQAIWPETVVSEAALTSCITELREILRDQARERRYIETVHRRGFRFIGQLNNLQGRTKTPTETVHRKRVDEVRELERKLVAILSADVKGYSRLMGEDEVATIRTLTAYREVMATLIQQHRGRVVDSPGDNLLAEFSSVVDAVQGAIEVQKTLKVQNAECPIQRRMEFRIGINLGDVVVEGGRIYGDGVNIAARVESLAEPGGICVSGTVHEHVKSKLALRYEDLGERVVKNIAEPVRVYRVTWEPEGRSTQAPTQPMASSQYQGVSRQEEPRGWRREASPLLSQIPSLRPQVSTVVGRELELAQLHTCFAKALNGERQIIFVAGEPGIGKTTLVEAFLTRLADEYEHELWLGQGQCIEHYGTGEAYLPLLEALGRLGRESEGQRFIQLLSQQAPTWLVQMPALLTAPELEMLQRKTQGATRERMLRELAEAVEQVTAERPLVLWLEDLHWSDVSTLDWLAFVARRRESARLLIIGTYRPVDVLVQGHPLRAVKQELQTRGYCTELLLDFLNEEDMAKYLAVRFASPSPFREEDRGEGASRTSLQRLARTIHRRTDGNPLFMVNVVNDLLVRGVLMQSDSRWELKEEVEEEASRVPENLQQLIGQQIERLSPETQRLLEVASVAGTEFSAAAVAAGMETEVDGIEEQCEALVRREHFLRASGTAEWPDGTVAARYGFLHAMYQEVLYHRLTTRRRQHLHQQIGEREEQAYCERASEVAAELAMHFERGRDYHRAVQYLQQAGENAVRRSAHQEAINLLAQGLKLLKLLPDTSDRARQELSLQVILGSPLLATKGHGAPELESAYSRARELCQQVGATPQLFPALMGLFRFHWVRELATAQELAEQLLHLARNVQDPSLLLEAHYAMGGTLFHLGEFVSAREHLEQASALYDPQQHRSHAFLYGFDPGVGCRGYAARALCFLGYPDQALRRSQEVLRLAQDLAHPLSMFLALSFVTSIHRFRGETHLAYERSEAALRLATEQGFAHAVAMGTMQRGWALAEQGRRTEGIALLHQGLAAYRATGAKMEQPYYLALLAEAYGKEGQVEEGLTVLGEALAAVNKGGARRNKSELYRLQGELTLQRVHGLRFTMQAPHTQAEAEAEACFLKAIEIARTQQAKSWELRASTSLARLWRQQGKTAEAHQMLSEVYNWFTEGFDTKDLQEAKALLEELG